jgi:hypothetical protein
VRCVSYDDIQSALYMRELRIRGMRGLRALAQFDPHTTRYVHAIGCALKDRVVSSRDDTR